MNGTRCFFVRIINTEGEDSSYFLPFLYSSLQYITADQL